MVRPPSQVQFTVVTRIRPFLTTVVYPAASNQTTQPGNQPNGGSGNEGGALPTWPPWNPLEAYPNLMSMIYNYYDNSPDGATADPSGATADPGDSCSMFQSVSFETCIFMFAAQLLMSESVNF